MFGLFEPFTGEQHGFVTKRNSGDVANAEVPARRSVAGRFDLGFMPANEVEPPLAVLKDRAYLLDVLDCNVRIGVVGTQDEVGAVVLRVPTFRETDVAVLFVVLEAVFLNVTVERTTSSLTDSSTVSQYFLSLIFPRELLRCHPASTCKPCAVIG